MTTDEEKRILMFMREARHKARGYADYFGWGTDRDIEEWGVVNSLSDSLALEGKQLFYQLKRRGRTNDPPDCEALNQTGQRVAIEVTELVDGKAIQAFKSGASFDWNNWDQAKFITALAALITRKDARFVALKDPPYNGGYYVVVFTDEPMLDRHTVEAYLKGFQFDQPQYITKAFLLVSYDPRVEKCPYYALSFMGV